MKKLSTEIQRLYGPAPQGQTRTLCLAFSGPDNWERLCTVANALQAELDLPAPAVSISGSGAFGLWLSLATPVPLAQAQEFMQRLCAAYSPETRVAADAAHAPLALPPYLDERSGTWAAFINPGMGASFAGESGLDIAPPEAGQLGLLERLHSVDAAQFAQALDKLPAREGALPQPAPRGGAVADGLLLKDATLEDIVALLHARNIEPTFRFLQPPA